MKVKPNNYIAIEFPSRSVNEGLARAAVAAFAAQLDPTLDELGDIVVEEGADGPELLEDYIEDVRGIVAA